MRTPDELKLPKPDYPDPRVLARELTGSPPSPPGNHGENAALFRGALGKGLIEIANNAWRLRGKLVDRDSQEAREEISKADARKMARHIDRIYEAFKSLGIEIKDRTGEPFDYGLPEKVVSASQQADLKKEQIAETLRPTIYLNDRIEQVGEVIIATPIEEQENPDTTKNEP